MTYFVDLSDLYIGFTMARMYPMFSHDGDLCAVSNSGMYHLVDNVMEPQGLIVEIE